MFLEIRKNSQENTRARVSFLIKLQALGLEIQAQVFSCEFYEISKNTSVRLLLTSLEITEWYQIPLYL